MTERLVGTAGLVNPPVDTVTLYRRTYMSVLRSSGDIPVRALQAEGRLKPAPPGQESRRGGSDPEK